MKRRYYEHASEKNLKFVIYGIKEICIIEKENPEQETLLSKKIKLAIRNKEIIIAFKNNKEVGFIWGTFTKKIPYGINFGNEKKIFCWVSWTYVIPSERNKGIGHYLYKLLEKECKKRGVNQIRLDVFIVNKNSEKFHLKLGFKPQLTIYRKKLKGSSRKIDKLNKRLQINKI